jgi:hypothetical protein
LTTRLAGVDEDRTFRAALDEFYGRFRLGVGAMPKSEEWLEDLLKLGDQFAPLQIEGPTRRRTVAVERPHHPSRPMGAVERRGARG